MSNVLIGIIGVILFIGLALAGALILGSDFTTANASSRAAAVMSGLDQMANAANMYSLKTGSPAQAGTQSYLIPRFLKAVPINTMNAGYLYDARTESGSYTGAAAIVETAIPLDDYGRKVCIEIAQDYGTPLDSNGNPVLSATIPSGQAGYFQSNNFAGLSNMYLAFKRI